MKRTPVDVWVDTVAGLIAGCAASTGTPVMDVLTRMSPAIRMASGTTGLEDPVAAIRLHLENPGLFDHYADTEAAIRAATEAMKAK